MAGAPTKTKAEKEGYIKTHILKSNRIFNNVNDWYQRLYEHLYRGYVNSASFGGCEGEITNYIGIHDTQISDGVKTHAYKRKSLGVPLTIAQHMKKLVFGKGIEVKFTGADKQKWFDGFFKDNAFMQNEKDAFEEQVAVGDKVERFYKAGDKVLLDYVPSRRFIETETDNANITGGIFVSYRKIVETEGKKPVEKWLTLLEWQSPVKRKTSDAEPPTFTTDYVIRREIYMSDQKNQLDQYVSFNKYIINFGILKEVEVEENIEVPLFEFSKNPINNSKAPLSKRGQSIYGGKLDQLQVLDTVYDGMYFEYLLKQYMVVAPEEAFDENMNGNKEKSSSYNPRRAVLQSSGKTGDYEFEWKDFNPDIRDQSFIAGLNLNLDITAVGMGLSAGELRFDGKSIQTATQVKAERNETFNTVEEYEANLAESWTSLFIKVATYAKQWGLITWELTAKDIQINFDKSDTVDKQQQFTNDLQAVSQRIMPKEIFRERYYKLNEDEETKWKELLENEDKSTFGFGEEDDDEE